MRLFLDTNIVLEYLLDRERADEVSEVFDAISDYEWDCHISTSSLYTIVYVFDRQLRKEGFTRKGERLFLLREKIAMFAGDLHISSIENHDALSALADMRFDDIEDSLQFATACAARCQVLLTFNIADFQNVKAASEIEVLTPHDFILQHLR